MVIVTGRGHCIAVDLIFIPRFLFANCVVKFFSYAVALFLNIESCSFGGSKVQGQEKNELTSTGIVRAGRREGVEEKREQRWKEMERWYIRKRKMVVGGRMERVEKKLVFYVEGTFVALNSSP